MAVKVVAENPTTNPTSSRDSHPVLIAEGYNRLNMRKLAGSSQIRRATVGGLTFHTAIADTTSGIERYTKIPCSYPQPTRSL